MHANRYILVEQNPYNLAEPRRLEGLLQQLLEIGQEIAAAVPTETTAGKSKKRASAKRGK